MVGPRILTYHGDQSHLIGEEFTCPRFMLNGGVRMVTWVVTDAVFQEGTNLTFVELDVKA